jgi:hypothetical protein
MDTTKEKTDLEKLLESINADDTVTISNPGAMGSDYGAGYDDTTPSFTYNNDTITLSSSPWNVSNNTITAGGFSFPNTASVTAATTGGFGYSNTVSVTGSVTGGPYTIGGGTGFSQPWGSNQGSPKINLNGEGADIEVNGWSLVDAIKKIEQRLNILTPNENLESEWEELRTLGEQYRKLEQHILDKQATWDRLKAMPPPAID